MHQNGQLDMVKFTFNSYKRFKTKSSFCIQLYVNENLYEEVFTDTCASISTAQPQLSGKSRGELRCFWKLHKCIVFFLLVSILNHNLQLKLSFPHLYKMAMIQTKTDWKSRTPQLTHFKSDSETWSFCSTKRKSLLKSKDHNVQFIHGGDAICVINKHKSSSVTPSYCSREPIDHNHGVSKKELGISGKL